MSPRCNAAWTGPLGRLGVQVADELVTRIERLPPGPDIAPDDPLAAEAVRQLAAWFADPSRRFDLPLAPPASAFQRRLRAALAKIPAGDVVTYGALARWLGSAPRAVGAACGANPLPIVVPCHRVVAADGIGGYARGDPHGAAVAFKRRLLELETRLARSPGG